MMWVLRRETAVSSDGSVTALGAAAELRHWYRGLDPSDIVWTYGGGGLELPRLADCCPDLHWTGRVGAGSLLALRARGGADVRDPLALLPWVTWPEGPDVDAARELL
ncbi:MAG: hypothetical protein IIA54_00545, partial [Chloroflexi bacterium]|nr:hypothetical protein [Chloroflexota bacterium]